MRPLPPPGHQILSALLVLVVITSTLISPQSAISAEQTACTPCLEFNRLNTLIRDGKTDRRDARHSVSELLQQIRKTALEKSTAKYSRADWIFPLEGLNLNTAGNRRGRDYAASGYDYFDGNNHGGHPSLDLFIHDRNQDSLDDRTGRPVSVLSMTGGIVVAIENEWERSSRLRGGKYIWIYDIYTDGLVYYAHNSEVMVRVGDMVKPGDPIARVGRTGKNACKKRSPTHLHLTYLKIKDGYPRPENIHRDLKQARTVTF